MNRRESKKKETLGETYKKETLEEAYKKEKLEEAYKKETLGEVYKKETLEEAYKKEKFRKVGKKNTKNRNTENKKTRNNEIGFKTIGYFLLVYIVLAILFYLIAKEQITYRAYSRKAPVKTNNIGEIVDGDVIEQILEYDGDYISSLSFQAATYARTNTGTIRIIVRTEPFAAELSEENLAFRYQDGISCMPFAADLPEENLASTNLFDRKLLDVGLLDGSSSVIAVQEYDMAKIADNSNLIMKVEKRVSSSVFYIQILSDGAAYGNAITFYSSEELEENRAMLRNGQAEAMTLCIGVEGGKRTFFGSFYWEIVFLTGIFLLLLFFWMFWKGDPNRIGNRIIFHCKQYGFLVNQLVKRDFKTKYKRSTLGFFWSFLNPLFTMIVQYIVFSTIFRSDIENFPVYLLSAGIVFNFFTESVGGGLCAIVGNASLITKVYVPKYIYPFSKVLSTAINLVISMLPLLLAVWITGEEITTAFLLIPFLFLCLIGFCVGMSLILSTSMVFFRDTQFLWGIISLVWMYATPIFYPESIIPEHFAFILKGNPMYHYLKFFRTVLMQGVSPQMAEYGYCIGFAVLFLLIGAGIFQRAQNKFVLYL